MVLTLIIALLSLVGLMIIHEFGHFIIAKKFGVKVEEFGIGYPPRLVGKKIGETVYSLNLVPLGAFVKIYGEEGGLDDYRSFSNLAIWRRVLIVLGGVLAFWIASAIIFTAAFSLGAAVPVGDQDVAGVPSTYVQVVQVLPNSPAAEAGLAKGDRLVTVQSSQAGKGMGVNKISAFQDFIKGNQTSSVVLTIERDGKFFTTMLQPRAQYPANQGPLGLVLQRMANVIESRPWYEAPVAGVTYTGTVTWQVLVGIGQFFGSLVAGHGLPQGAQLAGPVGITIFLSEAASYGPGFFLYFIGSLSVLLAVFNLFPIPALDGGKLVFLLAEKIKGSPVSVKIEQTLTITCFVLLISLSLFITVKFDFPRVAQLWQNGL